MTEVDALIVVLGRDRPRRMVVEGDRARIGRSRGCGDARKRRVCFCSGEEADCQQEGKGSR